MLLAVESGLLCPASWVGSTWLLGLEVQGPPQCHLLIRPSLPGLKHFSAAGRLRNALAFGQRAPDTPCTTVI